MVAAWVIAVVGTGVGGLGLVLAAGVLVIALFVARGLRLSQRQR